MSNVKKNYLVNQIKEKKWLCWRVYQSDGKTLISAQNETDISPEDSSQLLSDFLNNCIGNVVIITSCDPFEEGLKYLKAGKHFTFRVNCSDPEAGINGRGISGGGISIEQYLGSVQEVTNLKMELLKKDMEASSNSPAIRIAEKIVGNEKFMNGITDFLTRALVPAAKGNGINGPAQPLNATVEEFKKIDPDADQTLQAFVQHIKKHPEVLDQVKTMLGLKSS